jgi:hypothetical protein
MARPRKGTEIGATRGVALRITEDQREGLDAIARRNRRSLSDEIRVAIDRHLEAEAKIVDIRRRK